MILALDISQAATGYATGGGDEPPHTGACSFDHGLGLAVTGNRYRRWLADMILMSRPRLIAYEAPLMSPSAKGSTHTAYLQIGLSFVTEMEAEAKGIACVKVHVQSWRKAFLGHGRPADPKDATMAMCRLLGWDIGNSDDRADAAGVWAWAHLHKGNRSGVARLLSAGSVRNFRRAG